MAPSTSSSTVVSYATSSASQGSENVSSTSNRTAETYGSVPTTFSTRISSTAAASVAPSTTSPSGEADNEDECEADY